MLISDFDYILPHERIAVYPPEVRGSTRLLVCDVAKKLITDSHYANLDKELSEGDVLILNDTKVIPARLKVIKSENKKEIELLLAEKKIDAAAHTARVIYRGKLRVGDELQLNKYHLVVKEILPDGLAIINFALPALGLFIQYGEVPIPPYLERSEEQVDRERYQTIWAKQSGSLAAPTASLNMTEDLIDKLKQKGVEIVYITLHVGIGTFLPIRTDTVEDHQMHAEYFEVDEVVWRKIAQTRKTGKKICAVGTTVTRTLEYLANQISKENQLEIYDRKIIGEADIFIYPGYSFQVVDYILTNFHAPRSTPLMLVSAALGVELTKKTYQHALDQNYNFLSYGDSMLIKLK